MTEKIAINGFGRIGRSVMRALEVTLRAPAALDAIRAMSQVPGGYVGAGTLIPPEDVRAAKEAGAPFSAPRAGRQMNC